MSKPRHLSYANVMATVAVFIALSGGAYAAGVLPANSVGTKQLKKRAVTAAKIARGAVTGAAVKNGSLTQADFAANAIPAGPKGDQGDPGAKGEAGAAGATGVVATASTSKLSGVTLPEDDTEVPLTVVDLASVNEGAVDRRITTSTPAVIMAMGYTTVYSNAADAGQVFCQLAINDGTAAGSGLTAMGPNLWFNFPATLHYNNGFSVSASAAKPAGTYNVALRCANSSVATSATASLSNLTVWATRTG